MEVFTLIASIIGALAWLPTIIDKLQKSKIQGKIINYFQAYNSHITYPVLEETRTLEGLQYIIKLSFVVTNRNFNLRDIKVNLKYHNDPKIYKGELFWPNNFVNTNSMTGRKQRLKISPNESISFLHSLKKDETINAYLIFIVNKKVPANFEEFEFVFINHKKEKLKMKFRREDIDFKNILREDDMFEPIT